MTHLETYLDCLKLLPNEFQRELVLLADLDRKAALVQRELDAWQTDMLELARGDGKQPPPGGSEPSMEDRLRHIRELQRMTVDLHAEKLALAKQAKDMVSNERGGGGAWRREEERRRPVGVSLTQLIAARLLCRLLQIVSYAARLDDDIELFKEELPPEGAC